MRKRIFAFTVFALVLALMPHFTATAQEVNPVWFGQYYANGGLSGSPAFTRNDAALTFNWGLGSPQNLPVNGFSIRWMSDTYFPAGTYRFWMLADDNVQLTVDYTNVIIDTFATQQVDELVAADVTLAAGTHHLQIDYREVVEQAFVYFDVANLATNPLGPDFNVPTDPTTSGIWTASYYANPNLAGNPFAIRQETRAGGNWGSGSPFAGLGGDTWSARWVGTLFLENGNYAIRADADDGIRVYVDNVLVIDEWHIATRGIYEVNRTLTQGNHTFVVEFYESGGIAYAAFDIVPQPAPPTANITATVISSILNVREQPRFVNSGVLTRVNYGEIFPAISRTADGTWIKINANGVIGWVNNNFVNISNLSGLPIENMDEQPTGFTATASPYTVNIRTGPGTQFRDIANLPVGRTAQVIGRNPSSTWWQISYHGLVGWVSAQFTNLNTDGQIWEIPVTS